MHTKVLVIRIKLICFILSTRKHYKITYNISLHQKEVLLRNEQMYHVRSRFLNNLNGPTNSPPSFVRNRVCNNDRLWNSICNINAYNQFTVYVFKLDINERVQHRNAFKPTCALRGISLAHCRNAFTNCSIIEYGANAITGNGQYLM